MTVMRLQLDEPLAELLGSSPEFIERNALELIVLELYRRRELSADRAVEVLDLEKFAFIRWSGSLGIPYLEMTPEEGQQELRVLENR